jgi:hypothetical protein
MSSLRYPVGGAQESDKNRFRITQGIRDIVAVIARAAAHGDCP